MYEFSLLCEYFCSKPSIFVANCIKLIFCPREFSHRDMYIAPSSGHTSFNFNMPFNLILRRCEMSEFLFENWWKSIPIHQNYTMALNCRSSIVIVISNLLSGLWKHSHMHWISWCSCLVILVFLNKNKTKK